VALSQLGYRLVLRATRHTDDRNWGAADHQLLAMGGTYRIPPKTAHLVANRSDSDARFLLVQGVGTYDFLRVG